MAPNAPALIELPVLLIVMKRLDRFGLSEVAIERQQRNVGHD
jgi:hypothetical protein